MKKFLLRIIIQKYKILKFDKFKNAFELKNQTEKKNIELFYIRKSATLPIDFKYYSFIVFF